MSKEVQVVSGRMKMISNDEVKKKLVQESYESGLSLNQFAKERGISPASLCQWRKKFPEGSASPQSEGDCHNCQGMKKEILKLKAYLGHKIYELDSERIA